MLQREPGRAGRGGPVTTTRATPGELKGVLEHLKAHSGLELAGLEAGMVERGIRRHMQEASTTDPASYLDHLAGNPAALARLSHHIFLNVTSFFRDPEVWEALPSLIAPSPQGQPLTAWSAGCASGEEAWTLAMVMSEARGSSRVRVLATDIDVPSLAHAARGLYSEEEMRGLPAGLRRRYFKKARGGFTAREELRNVVRFVRADLAGGAPLRAADVIVCRHTLMYFDPAAQEGILRTFSRLLPPGGLLLSERTDRIAGGDEGAWFRPLGDAYPLFVRA